MAQKVVSGRFYYCSFPKKEFMSLTGRELVFVLFSQFNESPKESLVAHATMKWGNYKLNFDRVYTIPWDRLDDFEQSVDERRLARARKDLEKKLKDAK